MLKSIFRSITSFYILILLLAGWGYSNTVFIAILQLIYPLSNVIMWGTGNVVRRIHLLGDCLCWRITMIYLWSFLYMFHNIVLSISIEPLKIMLPKHIPFGIKLVAVSPTFQGSDWGGCRWRRVGCLAEGWSLSLWEFCLVAPAHFLHPPGI